MTQGAKLFNHGVSKYQTNIQTWKQKHLYTLSPGTNIGIIFKSVRLSRVTRLRLGDGSGHMTKEQHLWNIHPVLYLWKPLVFSIPSTASQLSLLPFYHLPTSKASISAQERTCMSCVWVCSWACASMCVIECAHGCSLCFCGPKPHLWQSEGIGTSVNAETHWRPGLLGEETSGWIHNGFSWFSEQPPEHLQQLPCPAYLPPDWPVGMGYWRTEWRHSSIINGNLLLFERLPGFVTISILSWLDTYLMNSIKPLTALNSSGKWLRGLKWSDGCCLSSLPKRKWFFKMLLPPCVHIHMLWNPDVCLSFLFKDINLWGIL